ncbi:uncharacterized protein magl isoform X2 [Tachysurus fulvidraco]|uniref:uncharacterized protein magl isoform X2 n=1 Tax=Tachysurus fulvidraco TaxID=1234273 RepID=UPI001FF06333|nr:uncharacterized protein magl isoform X2 [Tachysurus fulvidraco]
MEGTESDLTLEMKRLTEEACLHTSHSVSEVLKPSKIDECGSNQTNQVTLSSVTLTQSSTQESHMNGDVKVTLENESVWSRFHELGTEMILTKQGRRMFPCCRFKLSGLDPQRKYFLVMDIMALDDFTYKWNGKTWEPVVLDESHVLGQICVHPESPALGQQWMDSTVSFYKVKLSNDSMDQEGCVRLHPMHRYLPRLCIVPFDPNSGGTIALDSPKVKIFSFPQTAFYAVTSYQNPRITQLKIDCNPFAMAFREDSQSICLLQDKPRPCSSVGTRFRAPLLSLARNFSGKWKEGAVKNRASTRIQDNRERGLSAGTESLKEGEGIFSKMKNAILSCPNNTDYSENDRGNDSVYNCTAEPVLDEYMAPLEFEQSDPLEEPLPIADEPFPPISSTENSKSSESFEHAVSSYLGCQNSGLPTKTLMSARSPQTEREIKSVAASLPRPPLNASEVHEQKSGHLLKRRRAKKAKSKLWSRAKYKKPPPTVVPLNAPSHPDLEDVDGMLFVSFVAKEALKIPAENTKESETSMLSPSPTHDQSDNHEAEDVNLSVPERIAKLEKILLLHLKQRKHRQVIHPCLQDVGMKLALLDPKLPIDLQYLGVQLPPLPALHKGSDKMHPMSLSPSGKTNDPTKIKGWKDKFKTNTVQSTTEGLKNSSAFCSEMLDAYLENEAQQISDRVAVFSKCSASPVSYQLPSKSSSYVVTLDSLLKSRSLSSKKDYTKPTDEILLRSPLRGSPNTAISLSSAGLQGNREKGRNFACSLQAQQDALSTLQASKSVSRGEIEKQPGKYVSVKARNKMLLQEMEKKAMDLGKLCTHITAERAKIALTSLINFKKSRKRTKYYMHRKNERECPEDFCRLGCVCDSLGREIRGPTHCRRVECMFDCNCFKHKVLRCPPKETANVHQGRKSSVLAFSISDPETETRPPPAPSITTLWKRNTGEYDPEPIFTPEPSLSSKKVPYLRTSLNSFNQVREEDKDPVYLYFESMMTCARVREYNSNPPPQIHMFPTKKEMAEPEELNEIAEAGEPTSSQKARETNPTEIPIKTFEPKPTKLLEILSECNWEPHRNLVLSTLFRRMNSDLLSEPFCFGMYKIQLLSTTIKGVDRSSTITYKVCISRANEKEMTEDLQPPVKKGIKRKSVKGVKTKVLKMCETRAQKEGYDSLKQQKRFFSKRVFRALPYRTHAAHVGCLKADKKKPGSPTQSLIKVNGKMYSKAKLLLGQLGALHRVNRIAAFVTGRLQHVLRDQTKCVGDITKTCLPKASLKPSSKIKVTNVSRQTNHAAASEPEPKNSSSNNSPMNALSQLVGSPPGTTTIVPDGTRFVLMPVTFSTSAAASSAETVNSSTLPPGQQVVLQPAPGSNFLCQYNGQMIQLKPISTGPLVQPQPSSASEESTSQVMEAPYNTCLPKDTKFLQMPLISTPLSKALLKPLPDISPNALSLSAKSGMNVASGVSAFNLQSSFPGKTGTFSFRICPPTGQGKTVRSEHGGKPPEPSADRPSAVLLPGGFTLIKLLQPAAPAVPANVTDFHQAEIPQNDENMRKSNLQSGSPSIEQNHQVSESISKPLLPETSNSEHGAPASLPSEDAIKDEPVEHFSASVNTLSPDKYNWVPEGAVMVHRDVSELETEDLDDWPPNGAERILWIDSADEEENENPPSEEASEPKTTTTGNNFSSCDERLVDNLQDACSKSSPANEQKHPKSSISSNEKDCDSFINANNSYTAKISKQEPPFSVPIKKVGNNNPSQILSGSHNISVQFQEDCPSVHIKNDPYNTTDMDMAGNEPGIKGQGRLAEHSTLAISRIETNHQTGKNTFLKHVQLMNERLDSANNNSVSTKIESCSDSLRTHTSTMCDVAKQHIGSEDILLLMNKEEPSMNQTVTEFPQDPNKQGLDSKNSSPILTHMEFYNNPSKPNTTASLHTKEILENADLAGNAQCCLLDSQILVISTPTAHPLNTASLVEKTGLQCVSPIPHNKQKLSPELSDGFANLSDNCTKSSKISESNEGKDEALDRNKTAVRELCSDYEIAVDVMNLSEDEAPILEFDRDEADSIASGETSSDDEDSSNISTSDSETTDDTMDLSCEDYFDAESFEDNDGKRCINMINVQTRHKHKSRKATKLEKKIKYFTSLKTSRYLPLHELEKRLNHTQKERVRRDEMRQSFVALKKALNVEERVKMCNHDILNQARLTIWALKDRGQCLEERKKALLQRKSAYLHKIVELSEKTEDGINVRVQEQCEQQKQIGSQNALQTSVSAPLVNPQRLDSDANRLPPSLGCGKAPNYIRKTALRQPPITTTDEQSLPKIALQSFGKTDAVKHTYKTRTSQASSTEVSKSAKELMDGNLDLNVQTKEMETCSATGASNVMEKTLVAENSNKESPAPSSEVTGNDVQNKTMFKLENEQASAVVVKVRKKIGKNVVVIEETVSNPDALGPRKLRQRPPAVTGVAKRGRTANKRRRII